jgi:hypothetical protein
MGMFMDTCSAEMKKMMDDVMKQAKASGITDAQIDEMKKKENAERKVEYAAKETAWDGAASGCKTNSGMDFSTVASANGYEDNVDSMFPASAWFTSAFGLLLAMAMLLMK